MILRRLATALRRQDWFTVVVEFVIVVAGIFVGLQVTEWNEQRQLREREINYLIRLAEDAEAMRAELAEIQARAEGRPEPALFTTRPAAAPPGTASAAFRSVAPPHRTGKYASGPLGRETPQPLRLVAPRYGGVVNRAG